MIHVLAFISVMFTFGCKVDKAKKCAKQTFKPSQDTVFSLTGNLP